MTGIPQRLDIHSSPWKLIILGVLGIGMTVMSAAVAFHWLDNVTPGGYEHFMGYVGVFFFALCTFLIFWRALTSAGPVLTITPEGIRDTRIAADFIPWTGIRGISTWSHSGQKILVLAVDPDVETRLSLTRIAKWTRGANAALGANGLCIAVTGLKIDYDTLLAAVQAYMQRAAWPRRR